MNITIINKHTGLYRVTQGVPRRMLTEEQYKTIKASGEVETEHCWVRRSWAGDLRRAHEQEIRMVNRS